MLARGVRLFPLLIWAGLTSLEFVTASLSSASSAPHRFGFHFPASLDAAWLEITKSVQTTLSASKDFFIGATAGGVASFAVFPIDLAKTRMQDQIVLPGQTPMYTNTFQTLAKVARNEGFRGLYSGVFAVMVGTAPSSALQLGCNNQAKSWFARELKVDVAQLPLRFEVLAGAFAGMCQVAAANPMESVKVIKQVQGHKAGSTATIIRKMGLGGLYQVHITFRHRHHVRQDLASSPKRMQ